MGNDAAYQLAERIIEYNYKKRQQEYLRQYQYLQNKKEIRKRRKNAWMMFLLVFIMMILCGTMVTMEIQVRESEERIVSLQTELSELKKQNKEAQKRLFGREDYDWIMQEAIKLGMSQATADRVVYYSIEENDCMEQYQSIPIS